MKTQGVRDNVAINFIWRFAERFFAQIVSFIVQIVIARILLPEEFGVVSLILVFTRILQVFIDCGLGNALIQKKEADDLDFSSVFYFNIMLCLFFYCVVFFFSPIISEFYSKPEMTSMIRILGLTIVISGVKNVQQAFVSRTLQFRKFFLATIGGTVISAFIGIALAVNNAGAWALIAQHLSNILVDTIALWLSVRWRPIKRFSYIRLRALFSYGWKLLVSALIDTTYVNLWQMLIGKYYSSADLAFYNRGNQFPNVIVSNINTSIDSVLLPVMSIEQNDSKRVMIMTQRSIKVSVFLMAPLMIGLAFVAPSVVLLVLTDKWLPCVPYLRLFCISYMFQPIHTANLNAIKAMGRSDLFLRLEIVKKIVGFSLLFISVRYSVLVMAYASLACSFICQIINASPNKRLFNYGYLCQIKDILPSILLALIMGVCIVPIKIFNWSPFITVLTQISLGMLIYFGGAKLFKIDSYDYTKNIVKSLYMKALRKA